MDTNFRRNKFKLNLRENAQKNLVNNHLFLNLEEKARQGILLKLLVPEEALTKYCSSIH